MSGRRSLLLVTAHASRAGGGVSVAVRDLARMMATDAHVRVLALADGPTRAEDEPEWKGIAVTTHATFGPARYGFSPGLLLAMLRARPDIVHVHGLWKFHCLAVLLLHWLRRTSCIVTPHGMLEPWIMARSPRMKRIIAHAYQNHLLRVASAVHVLTPSEASDVAASVGEVRCVVIPNMVELPDRVQPRPAWWRSELEGRDVFLFLGRLHSKKGCLELCAAWERLNAQDDAFRDRSALVFCGVVDDLTGFQDSVNALSARFGNVRYVGPQYGEEKHRSLAAATFFCLPSKSEGLPIAVVEAWAAGVPAIMTSRCNLPIGFERGAAIETGTDASSIAASLALASTLPDQARRTMIDNALHLVTDHFSARHVRSRYAQLYGMGR